MATAKTPGGEHDTHFDQLFDEGQPPPATKAEGGKENLQELEAFLDEFEKNLGDPKAAAPGGAAPTAEPAPAPVEPPASVNQPEAAEQLVHGLLKEDELNLDVQGGAAPAGAPEFEPQPLRAQPLDVPAFIKAAPEGGGKPVPAAAAGFSRIGFILALVLGGAALLIAIGAGWMALNASQAVQGIEMRVGEGGGGAADPRVAKLQNDMTALRKQVDDLSRNLEGSLGDLRTRVVALEKVAGVAPPAAGTPDAATPAGPKNEPPKPAAAPKPASPEAAKPAVPPAAAAKPGSPAVDATKTPPVKTAPAEAQKGTPAAPATPAAAAAPDAAKAPAPAAPAPARNGAPATTAPAAPQNGTAAATTPATAEGKGAAATNAPVKPSGKAKPVAKAGDWVVHLTSSDERRRAQAQLAHARARGLDARLTRGTVEGKLWYRVTVEGFATPEEARAYIAQHAQEAGFSAAWIARR